MTRDVDAIRRDAMLSEQDCLRAEARELRAEIERLEVVIAYGVDMRIALAAEKNAEIERLTEAHERIIEWSRAYPLTIFPEPDLKRARKLLEAGGMTLDAISAHAMRHVIEVVGKISRTALESKP